MTERGGLDKDKALILLLRSLYYTVEFIGGLQKWIIENVPEDEQQSTIEAMDGTDAGSLAVLHLLRRVMMREGVAEAQGGAWVTQDGKSVDITGDEVVAYVNLILANKHIRKETQQ